MTLVVRAKIDHDRMSDNGPSVRYTAVRATNHTYKDANEHLLKLINAYKEHHPELGEAANEAMNETEAFF